MARREPQVPQERPKRASKAPHEDPDEAQKASKMTPRWPPEAPRGLSPHHCRPRCFTASLLKPLRHRAPLGIVSGWACGGARRVKNSSSPRAERPRRAPRLELRGGAARRGGAGEGEGKGRRSRRQPDSLNKTVTGGTRRESGPDVDATRKRHYNTNANKRQETGSAAPRSQPMESIRF